MIRSCSCASAAASASRRSTGGPPDGGGVGAGGRGTWRRRKRKRGHTRWPAPPAAVPLMPAHRPVGTAADRAWAGAHPVCSPLPALGRRRLVVIRSTTPPSAAVALAATCRSRVDQRLILCAGRAHLLLHRCHMLIHGGHHQPHPGRRIGHRGDRRRLGPRLITDHTRTRPALRPDRAGLGRGLPRLRHRARPPPTVPVYTHRRPHRRPQSNHSPQPVRRAPNRHPHQPETPPPPSPPAGNNPCARVSSRSTPSTYSATPTHPKLTWPNPPRYGRTRKNPRIRTRLNGRTAQRGLLPATRITVRLLR